MSAFPFRGITVPIGYAVSGPTPLDPYGYVATRDDLNLPTHPTKPGIYEQHLRFIGRTVRVIDEGCLAYVLKTGLTDDHWEVDVTAPPPNLPLWANDTDYVEGFPVWADGQIWRCKTTHKSSAAPATIEDDDTYWESASADTYTNAAPSLVGLGQIVTGEAFNGMTFAEFMERQFYPDIPPSIDITANPDFGVREIGDAVANISLTVGYTQTKYPISSVVFHANGSSLGNEMISNPAGGNITHTPALSLPGTADVNYYVQVTDTKGLIATATGEFEFVNPIYIGVLDANVTASTVTEAHLVGPGSEMSKVIAKPSDQTNVYTCNNKKFAIWVPNEWGSPTSILEQNGLELLPVFEVAYLNVTNLAGTSVLGSVYIMSNPSTMSNYTVTFKFNS